MSKMTQAEVIELLSKPTISAKELYESGVFPLSLYGIYEAIKRGELEAIPFGKKRAILTAPLRRKLGMEHAA